MLTDDKSQRRSANARRDEWLRRVDNALRGGGLQAASQLALQALEEGFEDPVLLNLAASGFYADGRYQDAVELLKRASAIASDDPHVLNSLGVCLMAIGEADAALQAYDGALKLDPSLAAAHFNRGALLEQVDDLNGARSSYQRACELDGSYAEPRASLAWLDALAGNSAGARLNAQVALSVSPLDHLATMALASAELQEGELRSAEQHLFGLIRNPALTRTNRAIVAGLVGDLRDAEDRPDEAFPAYQACNAELKAMSADRFEQPDVETELAGVERLTAWFKSTNPEPWRESLGGSPDGGEPRVHVFLVGFPRSGTTLLENVLAAHPDVISLEEKDCLGDAAQKYLSTDAGMARLADLSAEEARQQRALYWSDVRKFGVEPRRKLFIDKLPLNSVNLPIVAKLFPDARVLFAVRDPRDVVLSCFRRRFALNAAMYELLTLDGAATYYDAVMRLAELYRDLLPLAQHIVRYESLVDQFEATAQAVCAFVGLEWHPLMHDFAAKARNRGIATPSAAQVARGLNRDGQGVWRRYRKQMDAVLPILEPWVQAFGYEPT